MRAAGLDVAALTDHATLSVHLLGEPLPETLPPGYSSVGGLAREGWARTGALADAADVPGEFTAIRGFEWSEPMLGHVNGDVGIAGYNHPGREPGCFEEFRFDPRVRD